jgi:Zn-dependent membrane protease YugP
VPVEEVPGRLTDHYDPTKRALFLSSDNFNGRTVAAVGVAAHESGHALQHQAAYGLFNVRMALVPVTQFASMAYTGILLMGIFLGLMKIALPIIIATFCGDNIVPARHVAGGIRRQPPGQGTIVPAGPRT